MRQQGSVVFWFCAGAALILALFGVWNGLAGMSSSILRLCFGAAGLFLLAGIFIRWAARRAERKAALDT
jgi:hypothetical protein